MSFTLRYTEVARRDLEEIGRRSLDALAAVREGLALAAGYPFSCRKALEDNPFLREVVVPDEEGGWVALFEIEGSDTITVLALRAQRDDDLH